MKDNCKKIGLLQVSDALVTHSWHGFSNYYHKHSFMKNMTHPAFILAILGTLLIVAGLITMAHMELGIWFLYLGAVLVGIFSIWAIIDIITANHLRFYQKMFWLIITISVPVMGGLIYYLMHQDRNRIVT